MKITTFRACAALAALLIVSPAGLAAQPLSHAGDVAALKAVVASFARAYETRDLDALMTTLVDSDEVALFLPNPFAPMLIEGRSNVRAVVASFFGSIPRTGIIRMTTHDNSYEFHGDLALNWNYTNIYVNIGGASYQYLARNTNIFTRVKGEWRLLHIHGSPVPKRQPAAGLGGNAGAR